MKKSIVNMVLLLFLISFFIPIVYGNSLISYNKKTVENTNPILNFYYDKQGWMLYLENIGDETAYNITISIHLKGFIIFGAENENCLGEITLESGERRGILFFPLVFGFGPVKVIYTANAVNADSTSITLRAFLIGPYPWLLRL